MSVAQFRAAMQAAGLEPPAVIEPGKLHRFPGRGRRGSDDAAWCKLFPDAAGGVYGDFRTGLYEVWQAERDRPYTQAEREAFRQRCEQERREREAEAARRHEEAAAKAGAVWKAARAAAADHPYLVRKRVRPTATLRELPADRLVRLLGYTPSSKGEPLQGRVLIAPIVVGGRIASFEMIDEAGNKSALSGGSKRGGYWATGPLPSAGRLVLAEGVATALSIAEALGEPVAAVLSVGNLKAAGEAIRAERPNVQLVVAADLGEGGEPHPEAVKAAEALRCRLVAPPADLGRGGDLNDLHVRDGLDAVRRCFDRPDVVLTAAANLRMEPVRWLWEGWLPRGKLVLLAGAPGSGKTTLAMQFAAAVSAGGAWPDGTRCEAGDVVIWSGEDDPADTLAPRLLAAGANLHRIHFVEAVRGADGTPQPFDPAQDMPRLQAELARIKPALLILDPVVSVVTGDSHKNAEVRRSLAPVVQLAEAVGCGVVGITHTTKGTAGREPWERVTGSLAFAALARLVLFAAVNRNEQAQADLPPRLLVRAKSNLGPIDGGFGYDIAVAEPASGIRATRIVWLGAVEGETRRLLAEAERWQDGDEGSELEGAKRFLADLLADGPLPARVIKSDADAAGHSWRTLHRAADALGVEKRKEGMKGGWTWRLPTKMPTTPEDANFESLAPSAGLASSADHTEGGESWL